MSCQSLLFPTTFCTELVQSDKEHEDIKRLLYLQDKIRAAWPSFLLSKHSRGELSISSKNTMDVFASRQFMQLL